MNQSVNVGDFIITKESKDSKDESHVIFRLVEISYESKKIYGIEDVKRGYVQFEFCKNYQYYETIDKLMEYEEMVFYKLNPFSQWV